MAFDYSKMRLVDGPPGEALYIYKTTDLISTVVTSGYFDDAVDYFNLDTGDKIIASTGASGAVAVDVLVATNTSGTVTVVNGS